MILENDDVTWKQRISLHLAGKYARIFVRGHYLFLACENSRPSSLLVRVSFRKKTKRHSGRERRRTAVFPGYICSVKRTVFESVGRGKLWASTGTDNNVQGYMSEHTFPPNGGYCVYYPSNIFRNTCGFEKWGIFNLTIIPWARVEYEMVNSHGPRWL